jgi:hypothetical protein
MLLLSFGVQNATVAEDQCISCHTNLGDAPSTLFQKDIHQHKGVSCADCHGGDNTADDPDKAMNKERGYIGVPKGNDIIKTCIRCHDDVNRMKRYGSSIKTDQYKLLATSVHGGASLDGAPWVAQCTNCHGAHGVSPVHSPSSPVYPTNVVTTCAKCHSNPQLMKKYNPSLPVDQLSKYHTSMHGMLNAKGNIDVAECASCHGSHNIYKPSDARSTVYAVNIPATCSKCHSDAVKMKKYHIPTDQYEKFAGSVHGQALLVKHDLGAPACNDCHGNHGAMPPGIESISNVCGTCHALNAELFSSSPHKKIFDQRKYPECQTCHSNHAIAPATDSLIGIAAGSTCVQCHSPQDNPKGYEAAKAMRQLLDSLKTSEREAAALIEDAQQKGMEVGEAKFKLRDVHQARLESRTMVHAFNIPKFTEVIDKGMKVSTDVSNEGKSALAEFRFRRVGLGVASGIITLLALLVYLYIRRLEKK